MPRGRLQQRNTRAIALWPAAEDDSEVGVSIPELGAAIATHFIDAEISARVGSRVAWDILCADGRSLHVEATLAPVTLESGYGVLVAVRDVTARRDAELALEAAHSDTSRTLAEREVLLKEVHHRVKNNLQIVSSLLTTQAFAASSDEARVALEESAHRIRSMSLVHEMLYGGEDMTGIDIAAYAGQLARELQFSLGIASELKEQGDPVILSVERAIPCGLLLNELITNAFKHGRSPDGQCRLHLAITAGVEDFTLRVSDEGPGLPANFELRRQRSLGMKILAGLVRQLGAKFEVTGPPGACFTLRIPVHATPRSDRAAAPDASVAS